MGLQAGMLGLSLSFTMGSYGQNEKSNFDQKINLFQPSNLSKALILEPKGPQPPYSDIWASLGSLDLDQPKKFFWC